MSQTHDNLIHVFGLLSLEVTRNLARATIADREKENQKARLFRALAAAQQLQADKILLQLRGNLPLTEENITLSEAALSHIADHFQSMIMTAAKEGETQAETTALQFAKASMAMKSLLGKAQTADATYATCTICGYITAGAPPERCPICRAATELFATAK